MKDSLRVLTENFLEDCAAVRKGGIILLSDRMVPVCAYIYAANGKACDPDIMKESVKVVKEHGKGLSSFRDVLYAPVSCMMTMSSDAEGDLDIARENFKLMKKAIFDCKYLSLVSLLLGEKTNPDDMEEKLVKAKAIYDTLRKKHKWVTGSNDSMLAVMLAFSNKSVEEITDEVEVLINGLKKTASEEYVQLAALLMTCSNKPAEEKCARFRELLDFIKTKEPKLAIRYGYMVLAALSLLDFDMELVGEDIIDVYNELGDKKGYKGIFATYGKANRFMHSLMLVIVDNMSPGMYTLETAAIFLAVLQNYDEDQEAAASAAIVSTT